MTTLEGNKLDNPTGCPVTNFTDVNTGTAPAGWHFNNFDSKREQAPVHTGDANGHQFFLITRMADIRQSFQNAKVFSNTAVTPMEPNPQFRWIPEMLDGREHTAWRQLTGPFFSPGAVAEWEPRVRRRFAEVLDTVAAKGSCEFVHEVALVFPNVIFMDIFGLPREDADQFQEWEVDILHKEFVSTEGQQRQMNAMIAVMGYFSELIQKRRADPRDDMLSQALTWKIDGELIPDQDLLDFCLLMFMAGLDTVAAQLTYSFWHLAMHDDDRHRIVAEPALISICDRGVPALLQLRHPRAQGHERYRDRRMPGQGRPDGVPPAGLGQSRSARVRQRRSGDHRPRGPTVTSPSAPDRIAVSAPTSPARSCRSRWRCGTSASPSTAWRPHRNCSSTAARSA